MTQNYLTLLEESLQNKLQVMDEIQQYNLRQQEVFQSEEVDLDRFDEYVEEKGNLIEKLSSLDNGFERLYSKVSKELADNRDKYKDQIKRLQELVTKVTETSVTIQAQEARNKKLIEDFFQRARDGIRNDRKTSKAAYDYYKNMSKSSVVLPQFMDKKK
ncbi:MAG: flagellar export chaperone FlgN [Acetatifactor sp.]|nr:flagellar export chaperone FlgN [Acetatifactor sp.]